MVERSSFMGAPMRSAAPSRPLRHLQVRVQSIQD
jgi:hypothetical protein